GPASPIATRRCATRCGSAAASTPRRQNGSSPCTSTTSRATSATRAAAPSRSCSAEPVPASRRTTLPRAVVVSAVRTPVGRYGGGLAEVRADDLAATAVRAAVDRAGVPEDEIEDVWLGCAN